MPTHVAEHYLNYSNQPLQDTHTHPHTCMHMHTHTQTYCITFISNIIWLLVAIWHCQIYQHFNKQYFNCYWKRFSKLIWNKTATLPVFHHRTEVDAPLKVTSACYVSDVTDHTAPMVFAILKQIVTLAKQTVPELKYIHYLSDSPSSQYRNKHLMYIIAQHDKMFGIPCTSAGSRVRGARGIYYPRGPFAADLQHLPLQREQKKQWGQKDNLSRGEREWQF